MHPIPRYFNLGRQAVRMSITACALPMYRATFIRPFTLGLGAVFAPQRTFATSVSRCNAHMKSSKTKDHEYTGRGTEGLHMSMFCADNSFGLSFGD